MTAQYYWVGLIGLEVRQPRRAGRWAPSPDGRPGPHCVVRLERGLDRCRRQGAPSTPDCLRRRLHRWRRPARTAHHRRLETSTLTCRRAGRAGPDGMRFDVLTLFPELFVPVRKSRRDPPRTATRSRRRCGCARLFDDDFTAGSMTACGGSPGVVASGRAAGAGRWRRCARPRRDLKCARRR